MKSIEELMRPRYKVIADYFYNPYKIGDIITVMYGDRSVHLTTTRYRDEFGEMVGQHNYFHPGELKNFPHLFQPLPWWSDREISDLPSFVKVIREDCVKDTGLYCKVYKWAAMGDKWPELKGHMGAELEGYTPIYLVRNDLTYTGQVFGRLNATHLLPATQEEYEQCLQQKG